jgi:hypothetical protein
MPGEEPKGLGFEGWLKRLDELNPGRPKPEKIDPAKPIDDMAKMQRLLELDRRHLRVMPRTIAGLANEAVVQELEEISAEYEDLRRAGPPRSSLYTEEALRSKAADALESAGRAAEVLSDYPRAKTNYSAAAAIYEALGDRDGERRCREKLTGVESVGTRDLDREILRLRAELATRPEGSIESAEAQVELASLYLGRDDFEAKPLLLEAERTLNQVHGDPGGADLAAALTRSMLGILGGQPDDGPSIQTAMKVKGLYRQLYLALARIYQATDPQKAADYRGKATRSDDQTNNDDFSKAMRQALGGDLGRL